MHRRTSNGTGEQTVTAFETKMKIYTKTALWTDNLVVGGNPLENDTASVVDTVQSSISIVEF